MNAAPRGLALALAASLAGAAAASPCSPERWLEDPGISPAALDANGYRVIASQTLVLDDGRQAVESILVRDGGRMARCRTVHGDGADRPRAEPETVCFLRCRTP